jgi:hypothetical protein
MAKSTNGGKTKATTAEPKARRAPARRRTDKKTAEAPIAMASELATPGQATATISPEIAALNPEEVRRRAYEIYVGRGCTNGCEMDDWLEAERQLRNRTH